MFRSQVEMVQDEALKVLEQLVYKNDPDLEVHYASILPSVIHLLETSNQSIRDQALQGIRVYCQMTQNVEQVLTVALRQGIENDNVRADISHAHAQAHIRHEIIKLLPDLISYGASRQIEKSSEFKMALDVLLLRARGDNTDSIRVQAQESIRQIMSAYNA